MLRSSPAANQAAGRHVYSSVVAIDAESSDARARRGRSPIRTPRRSSRCARSSSRPDREGHRLRQAVPEADEDSEAERASSDYILLHAAAARPADPQGPPAAAFVSSCRPRRHRRRCSPKPMRSAAIGLALGLFVGSRPGLPASRRSTRACAATREIAEIAAASRSLARIPRISRRLLDNSALVTITEPEGHSAEAFRMLRTNLAFMNVDGDVRTVVLTSCVQGEGKSVTVANLAVTMALGGSKVIVVDADLRRPRMHKYFGITNDRGVSTVVTAARRNSTSRCRPCRSSRRSRGSAVGFADWAARVGCEVPPVRASQRPPSTQSRRDRLVQAAGRRHRSAGTVGRHRARRLAGHAGRGRHARARRQGRRPALPGRARRRPQAAARAWRASSSTGCPARCSE